MNNNRESYYQAIAKRLFQLRGAPFVVSSRETEAIRSWEKMRIPLRVVLEGIETAFEYCSPGMKKRLTLNSCHKSVMRKFTQYQERQVGSLRRSSSRSYENEKKKAVREAAEKFLKKVPKETGYLTPFFLEVSRHLSSRGMGEEELEEWDRRIDDLIWQNFPRKKQALLEKEIKDEQKLTGGEELKRLIRRKAVKTVRENYSIPYLAPYYY
ncbi:MAG: hypothetical protein R6V02_01195 [Candidatus Aminicenantes bacterium]